MKMFKVLSVMLFVVFLCGNVWGLSFSGMKNITVNDNIKNSEWYDDGIGENQGGEDNETEYLEGGTEEYSGGGSSTSQKWDIEGMFVDESNLYVVGGFDFKNGVTSWNNDHIEIGDLFFGKLNNDGSFDSKYVIDISDGNIYSGEFNTEGTLYNDLSNPFTYKNSGTLLNNNTTTIIYGDADNTGFNGWYGEYPYGSDFAGYHDGTIDENHYYMQFIINENFWSLIANDPDAQYVHLTMECGNDTVRGHLAPVPEPTTMLLSGIGLMGMGFYLRRKKNRT